MEQSLLVLGRQPALGLAELESLFGADVMRPVGKNAVLLQKPASEIAFARLGGSVKLCKVLTELDTEQWSDIEQFLIETTPKHAGYLPDGKLQLGLSAYGLGVKPKQITATGLSVKKALKNNGRSARLIPNNEAALSSAQVMHNNLTGPLGWELVFVRDGKKTICAQTVAVQDIEAYAARDQKRPMRDAKVGMLPPKLAQIIVNLAVNGQSGDGQPMVLDPFCGTGVVLQEAVLMGLGAYGTDIDERMVRYTRDNLNWLRETRGIQFDWLLETGDATTLTWSGADAIASETYLGQPFSREPDPKVLAKVMDDVNRLHKKFFSNIARQTKPGFRMCVAVPAWFTKNGIRHLPCLDQLTEMGYTRVSFAHAAGEDLIYRREGQVVGRELVVIVRQ